MSVNWIKVQHSLPDKPEVFAIARIVGQNRNAIVGLLLRFWIWCDQNSTDGRDMAITSQDVDEIVGVPGFASAMRQNGWLEGDDGSLQVPNFERHNGNSAKARALETEAKRLRRLSDTVSDNCPTNCAQIVGPDERRARGDERRVPSLSKGDRKAIGSTDRRRSSRSPVDAFDSGAVDWELVSAWAERLGRKVKPRSVDDRRMWLRFAVLAQSFGEAWLVDGTEAVLQAKETRSTRQAHLVGVLKAKASEEHGIDGETFVAMLGRIEIPESVWKSNVLEVK